VKKNTKWNVTLNKEDKKPYGTYLAYQSLKYYFPNAKVDAVSRWFRYTDIDNSMKYNYDGASLLVMVGLDFYISNKEWWQILQFANEGNEVVLFCSRLDEKVEDNLRCYKHLADIEEAKLNPFNDGRLNINLLQIKNAIKSYGYEGRSLRGYFEMDSAKDNGRRMVLYENPGMVDSNNVSVSTSPDTLGYAGENIDLIRYKVGDGHITIHAAPLVLSNYFLLQQGNIDYLGHIWQTLPKGISHIYWNEYYKRTANGSDFSVLWRYASTEWALIIAIITLLIYIIFEGKRRQRIVPVIKPLENSSVTFVETVGRLYYNKGNHNNLAEKMIQHFLEWVRNHYYLNTNHLNETFTQQLTIKSGMPENTVKYLVEMIHEIRIGNGLTDETYLYELYNTIEQFYKNNPG
ncbi:MAG TPA: DUF4350 domain-containing protein, partial [Flavipsychrobacter sp.]|nr:DUF4350 domain-containing protein [Flavipsychrobacter sp.]